MAQLRTLTEWFTLLRWRSGDLLTLKDTAKSDHSCIFDDDNEEALEKNTQDCHPCRSDSGYFYNGNISWSIKKPSE